MNLLTWLASVPYRQTKARHSTQTTRPRRKTKRLTLQVLEQRQMLAADAIGVVSPSGTWGLDHNRDGIVDIDRKFGLAGDQFVSGDWTGSGDQMAVVRNRPDGFLQWYLNTDAAVSPVHEVDFLYGLIGDIAVAGDWDGNGTDNPAVVRRSVSGGLDWYKDLNRDPNAELVQSFGLHGDIPVVGDWDNNGTDNVGVVRPTASGHLEWFLDTNGDAWPEVQRIFGLVGDTPVVGDWNDDGRIDIGVARPVQVNGITKLQWLLDTNGDPNPDLPAVIFGNAGDRPVTGTWQFSEVAVYANNGTAMTPINDGHSGSQTINFGTMLTGENASRTFTVRNTGNAALALQSLTVPSGFTVTQPLVAALQPGQQAQFTVSMNSSAAGDFSGNIQFVTNDGNESPFDFAIQGRVETPAPQIQVVSSVGFGELVQGTTGTTTEKAIRITNTGNAPLIYTATVTGSQYRLISGASGTIARGQSRDLVVRLLTTSLGSHQGTVTIQSNSVVSATKNISLAGTVVAPNPMIQVQGNNDFGSVPRDSTGSNIESVFSISNPGNLPLNFNASLSNNNFVIVSGQSGSVAPMGSTSIIVRMQTSVAGSKSATLTITSNATNTPTLLRELTGIVTQPASKIQVTGSGAFANVALGSNSTRELVITNVGTAPLTYSANPSNSNYAIVSGSQATVPVGGTAKIVVRITTTTVGSKSATLNIATNDPSQPTVTVTLSGNVVTPEVDVTVGSKTLAPGETGGLFFGVTYGSTSTRTFVIRNSGQGTLQVTSPVISGQFTHNMPSSFTLRAGQSRTITVTMQSIGFGTKTGQLQFTTNDSDESLIRINLLGRNLPSSVVVPGNSTSQSVHTLYSTSNATIYIDPRHGAAPINAQYIITQGGSRSPHTALLGRLIIVSTTRPTIENWTNITVQWRLPNGSLVTLPNMASTI